MNRKPYPAYKPSGVDWLGEMPAHLKAMAFVEDPKFFVDRLFERFRAKVLGEPEA